MSRKEFARDLISKHGISNRNACDIASISRSQLNYKSRKKEDPHLIKEILMIKDQYPFYGLPRVYATLRRRGFLMNKKKVHRILKVLKLNVSRKTKPKRDFIPDSNKASLPFGIGQVWAMDFVAGHLINGTSFRCLTIVDVLSRQVPGVFVNKSMSGFLPVDYLEKLKETVKLPSHFILDNGAEFANHVFMKWCGENKITVHFIDPGKPIQNAYIESFNGKFRAEFLNQHKFSDIESIRRHLKKWIKYYNEERPHSSLDYMTPKEFADSQKPMLLKSKVA